MVKGESPFPAKGHNKFTNSNSSIEMEWVSPLKPPNGHKPIGMSYRYGKHLQFWCCLTEKTPLCLPWTWHTTLWHEKAEMAPKSNATCIDKIWTMLNMVMVQPLGWSPPILGHQDITCIVSRVHVIRHGNHFAPINSHIIPTEKKTSSEPINIVQLTNTISQVYAF